MITSELFGTAPCGTPVHRYTLNGPEICVRIMDYGATVLGIDVPDIPGNVRDVVLGFDKLEDYFDNPACFGATIGPVANRTAGATITIDGTDWHMPANEGANNLHSDLEHGLHKRVWDVELDEAHNAVRMTTSLEDGELGLPGNRTFTAVFTVTRTGVFRIEYGCESDRATYVSMTNHTYFNLAGHNAGMDCEHFFVANAAHYLPINEQNIPTGEITPVEGTPFDFRELRPVAPGMEADDPQIKQARGYDHCLCIDGYQYGRNLRRALHVEEMWTGRELDYFTTAPGVQLYTGNWLGDEHAKDDANYGWGAGFALEAEMYPDTPHQPLFPQGIVGPGHLQQCDRVPLYEALSPQCDISHSSARRHHRRRALFHLWAHFRCDCMSDISKLCPFTTFSPGCSTIHRFLLHLRAIYLRFCFPKFDMLDDSRSNVVNGHSFDRRHRARPRKGTIIRFPPSPRDQLNRLPMGSGAELGR